MINMKHYEEEPVVQIVTFAGIEPVKPVDIQHGIEMVQDVSLQLIAELGRTKLPVKDIIRLNEGAVIELDKVADEPIELIVDNKVIARGEVVSIDDYFGIRITEIIAGSL